MVSAMASSIDDPHQVKAIRNVTVVVSDQVPCLQFMPLLDDLGFVGSTIMAPLLQGTVMYQASTDLATIS